MPPVITQLQVIMMVPSASHSCFAWAQSQRMERYRARNPMMKVNGMNLAYGQSGRCADGYAARAFEFFARTSFKPIALLRLCKRFGVGRRLVGDWRCIQNGNSV